MKGTLVAAAGLGLLARRAQAHMCIQVPTPIPNSDSKSPLLPSGANFPCQGADLTQGTVTNMAVGSTQPLEFNLGGGANTAVHGGGSCQIAVAYGDNVADLKSPSSWKVIHTMQGGCMTKAPGNLDQSQACDGTNAPNCVNQNFTFTIPPEVKTGDAILSWTWFNNIGDREMYMNCAKISISGSGTDDLDSLPNLFTANIGNNCATTESTNLQIPNAGKYVTTDSSPNYPFQAPVGSGCAVADSASGGGNSTSAATSAASAAPSSTASVVQSSGGANAEGATGTTFLTSTTTVLTSVYATASAGGSAQTSAAPAADPSVATSPAPAAATGSTTGSGNCVSGQVACTASGFYCISETSWAECAFGCAIPMDVAAGTACSNNAIVASKKLRIRQVQKRSLWDWSGLSNWF